MRWPRLVLLITVLVAVPAVTASAGVPAWTTYRHDAQRSGIDPDSTRPVTPTRAWLTPALDGGLYGQPLVYGTAVYLATENDTIYKLDAATGAVIWSKHLATPEPSSSAPCGVISPTIGITSTPVIDPGSGRIYAVGAVSLSGKIHHELFALDIGNGARVPGFPFFVDPVYPSGGAPRNQLQRAGLALDGGRILIGYGANAGDCNKFWGWLVSAPTDGSQSLTAFQADKGYEGGGVWAGENAPTIDTAGRALIATGNGNGNSTSNPLYGDSVVKLSSVAAPLDWWAPTNWQSLDASDLDLGSSMPTLVRSGYLFQSGKDGNGYLLSEGHLGHVSKPVTKVSSFCSGGSFGGSVFDAVNSTLYAACWTGLRAVTVGAGTPPTLSPKAGFSAPSDSRGPPIIAGGLVWVTTGGSGALYGLNLNTGATKAKFLIPEQGSNVNHFTSPSAGGGRLFVASGNQVTAITIAQPPPVSRAR